VRALTTLTSSRSFFITPIDPITNPDATPKFRSNIIFASILTSIVSAKLAVSECLHFFLRMSRDLSD